MPLADALKHRLIFPVGEVIAESFHRPFRKPNNTLLVSFADDHCSSFIPIDVTSTQGTNLMHAQPRISQCEQKTLDRASFAGAGLRYQSLWRQG